MNNNNYFYQNYWETILFNIIEEIVQERENRISSNRLETNKLKDDFSNMKGENSRIRKLLDDANSKNTTLQQTITQQFTEISGMQGTIEKLQKINEELKKDQIYKNRVIELEGHLDERKRSAVTLAATIDTIASEKQSLVDKLEKAVEDLRMLRDSYTKQQELNSLLKDQSMIYENEIKKLQELQIDSTTNYKTKVMELEEQNQELQEQIVKFTTTESKRRKVPAKKMSSKTERPSEDKNTQQHQRVLLEKNEQIDKLKEYNSQYKKELMESSKAIAEYIDKNKELEEKIRKAVLEKSKLQERINIMEKEANLHRKEADGIRQDRTQYKKEWNELESVNSKQKIEIARLEQELKTRIPLAEHKKLKQDNLILQQNISKFEEDIRSIQQKLQSTEQEKEKLQKEVNEYKKLLEQRKIDIQKFQNEMENYAKILDILEKNMGKAQEEKEKAEKDKAKAIEEVTAIRKRYMNILGVESLPEQ